MTGRIRSIKPEFFLNDDVADLPPLVRLLFVGLWTLADKRGRLKDKPRRIKAALLPWDAIDVDAALEALAAAGLVVRYEVDGVRLLQVVAFEAHQRPNHREAESVLPACPTVPGHARECPGVPGNARGEKEGKGREKEGKGEDARARSEASLGRPRNAYSGPAPFPDDWECGDEERLLLRNTPSPATGCRDPDYQFGRFRQVQQAKPDKRRRSWWDELEHFAQGHDATRCSAACRTAASGGAPEPGSLAHEILHGPAVRGTSSAIGPPVRVVAKGAGR